jgi:hypothetical protein
LVLHEIADFNFLFPTRRAECFCHGGQQLIRVNGFEQVVDGAELDGADGVLAVSGCEDDFELVLAIQFEDFKTQSVRKLDVQKYQFWLE